MEVYEKEVRWEGDGRRLRGIKGIICKASNGNNQWKVLKNMIWKRKKKC